MTISPPIPENDPIEDDQPIDDLGQVRQLILASHTDIVPELVQGNSVADLVASINPAREAFSRIVDSMPKPVTIPAGGNIPVAPDIGTLPTSEKIRRGLSANRS